MFSSRYVECLEALEKKEQNKTTTCLLGCGSGINAEDVNKKTLFWECWKIHKHFMCFSWDFKFSLMIIFVNQWILYSAFRDMFDCMDMLQEPGQTEVFI